jgi:hypothetical protein
LALVACLILCPAVALAQAPDPFASARVHIGPFAVTPSFSVTNVGVDTNVFNVWQDPKSDFTATITPAADVWLRLGPARLNLELSGSYLYFAQYSDQRALGTTDSARLELPLLHVRPWVKGSFLTVRDRPGFEIDVRVRRTETAVSGGADLQASKRTTLGVSLMRTRVDYNTDAAFLGYSLRDALNRTTTVEGALFRYALTPLTTFVTAVDVVQERFDFSPIRDSDGFRVVPGLEFAATALISGSAHVGFRRLTMKTAGVPDYTGPVAAIDLGYALLGLTRFAIQVRRDVEYSFDPAQPYYLLTGVTGSVSQAVGGPWSIEARAGIQRLAYQTVDLSGSGVAGSAVAGRVDVVRSYGAGVGYKLGPSTRIGVNADYYTRRSEIFLQQYQGLRVGSSVTYGF